MSSPVSSLFLVGILPHGRDEFSRRALFCTPPPLLYQRPVYSLSALFSSRHGCALDPFPRHRPVAVDGPLDAAWPRTDPSAIPVYSYLTTSPSNAGDVTPAGGSVLPRGPPLTSSAALTALSRGCDYGWYASVCHVADCPNRPLALAVKAETEAKVGGEQGYVGHGIRTRALLSLHSYLHIPHPR